MEIQLNAPPGVKMEPITAPDGTMTGVRIIPFFIGSRSTAGYLYGSAVTASGAVTDQVWLTISGAHGKLRSRHRNQSAVPLVDQNEVKASEKVKPPK